jgi:hypothetical protein
MKGWFGSSSQRPDSGSISMVDEEMDNDDDKWDEEPANKVAYGSIGISLFCLGAMALVLPMLHYQLESASLEIEQRMEAFRVSSSFNINFVFPSSSSVRFQANLGGNAVPRGRRRKPPSPSTRCGVLSIYLAY